ncbi:hypothetical protein BC833DRAFT_554220 [Globomyces pollinis-pini]|nr:hypothetical protein BC833DRAFT_554220 [Globomyces pollinis-pini]
MDLQRQLLAELMNPLIPSAKKDFNDEDVCKYHLLGFCPIHMFSNTKADLGKCILKHDDKLQKEFLSLPQSERQKYNYENRFYDFLSKLINDVERTIRKGHQRLENKSDVVFDNLDEIREKILILEEKINPLILPICELGESGKVAEALDSFHKVLKLNIDLDVMRTYDPSHPTFRPDKSMEVCQVCGALLANDSTGARIDAHMIGKQHTGFMKIRKALEDHKKKQMKAKARIGSISRENEAKEKDTEREKVKERERDRDRPSRYDRDRPDDRDRDSRGRYDDRDRGRYDDRDRGRRRSSNY